MSSSPTSTPVALITSKRKFHKLLDNLTSTTSTPNKSTTNLASTLSDNNISPKSFTNSTSARPEPPSKRSRVSDVGASMERPRTVSGDRVQALKEQLLAVKNTTPKRSPGGVRLVNGSIVKAPSPSPARKAPNYAPYSQEAFLARLKTFADVKLWSTKPEQIEEVEWAKRGWTCVAWNTVGCKGGCERRVVVKLRPKRKDADGQEMDFTEDVEVEVEEGLVEKYKELIVTGHDEGCLWRRAGCKDDIYHIPIANRALSESEFLRRYHSLKRIIEALPPLDCITYPDPPSSDILQRLPASFFDLQDSDSTEDSPSIVPFTFALFGWTGSKESSLSLATCDHCFQRLGLWMYSKEKLTAMSERLDSPFSSLRLDLLESHREHCPWKNAATQANPVLSGLRGMAAWQTLEFMFLGRKNENKENWKSASAETGDDESIFGESEIDRRASIDQGQERTDKIMGTWSKLKTRLKRTASRRSLGASGSRMSLTSASRLSFSSARSVALGSPTKVKHGEVQKAEENK
ncbi:zf-C3HC-domain-containing protein [Delitschia confertaspora ATCC 74209]|uniref:Zf-C3HC-domain-containing protein n=1 Tax=Delitschia confertaspora ATCC 74209 TaxID=1513339 RepID=A0A9P4MRE6_9PLEO|nr:zf-C3HC-domain-containing protein [Delitschia confertaspora ATCC 74209]